MAKTDMIRARIEPEIKQGVGALLAKAGMTHSEFVGSIYREVLKRGELPVEIKLKPAFQKWLDSLPVSKNVPNAKTARAMRQSSKGLKRYKNFQEILDELEF